MKFSESWRKCFCPKLYFSLTLSQVRGKNLKRKNCMHGKIVPTPRPFWPFLLFVEMAAIHGERLVPTHSNRYVMYLVCDHLVQYLLREVVIGRRVGLLTHDPTQAPTALVSSAASRIRTLRSQVWNVQVMVMGSSLHRSSLLLLHVDVMATLVLWLPLKLFCFFLFSCGVSNDLNISWVMKSRNNKGILAIRKKSICQRPRFRVGQLSLP